MAAIDQIMADNYVRIQPDGSVADKAVVLAAFVHDRPSLSSPPAVPLFTMLTSAGMLRIVSLYSSVR